MSVTNSATEHFQRTSSGKHAVSPGLKGSTATLSRFNPGGGREEGLSFGYLDSLPCGRDFRRRVERVAHGQRGGRGHRPGKVCQMRLAETTRGKGHRTASKSAKGTAGGRSETKGPAGLLAFPSERVKRIGLIMLLLTKLTSCLLFASEKA